MIRVFTLNKNGKIELTKKELEQLLNTSYWEGYNAKNYWTYTSPSITTPYTTCTTTSNPYSISTNSTTNSVTLEDKI